MSIIAHEFKLNEDGKRECRACGMDFWLDEDVIVDCDAKAMIDTLRHDRDKARAALRKLVDLKRLKDRLPHVVEPDTARRVYLADRETAWAEAFRIVDATYTARPSEDRPHV